MISAMQPNPGNESRADKIWTVVDLFSGAGGASYGFHIHDRFRIVGAADAEIGKPSTGHGAIDCNATYLCKYRCSSRGGRPRDRRASLTWPR